MFNYLPLQWMFLFYFYSFFGWCFESTYVTIMEKRLSNRGFMRGPFIPLYGCGGITMLVASKPFYDNIVLVFIAGCIGATALEYVTGVLMETLFKVRYWDYSHKKFNYKGQICLESTIVWGVCTVVFTHFLQIPIEKVLTSIPYNVLSVVTIVITVFMTADFVVAFKTALDLRDVLIYMERAKEEMRKMQKRLDVIIAFKGEDMKDSIEGKVDAFNDTVENIGGGIGNTIGNTIEGMSEVLEKSFTKVKDKISLNPTGYVSSMIDEVGELYTKYRVLMSRMTPKPVKSFFDFYRKRTILGNPHMHSDEFEASMEEIKHKASEDDKSL